VTDEQQAQWLVRSLLVFSAMPVERAYVYFFNDDDQPSLHASAGITRHFQPKPSYHALTHLQRMLGEYRFQNIVTNEPNRLRVQEYGNDSKMRVWIVWSPTGDGSRRTVPLDKTPGKLVDAQSMALTSAPPNRPRVAQNANGNITLQATESPAYLVFEMP
jgi:hypothetical protein